MFRRTTFTAVFFMTAVFYMVLPVFGSSARADINSCSAGVIQHVVPEGSNTDFQFQINNSDNNSIQWIKITRPSDNFTINSAAVLSWTNDSNVESVTFQNGTVEPGSSSDQFVINTGTGGSAPSANWNIQVSDDSGGASPFNCGGGLGTAISSADPAISSLSLSSVSSNSVTVTWDSDIPATSKINYGLDSNYGHSSPTDSNLVTNHSVVLSNLSSNTGYHYQIVSTNPGGGSASSGDNTFLTAINEGSGSGGSSNNSSPLNVRITNPSDKIPPKISLSSVLPHVVQSLPTIRGTASDDSGVAQIEYSTDGGKNWLPVDNAPALASKQVAFSFTPINLDDGNYMIVARAIDVGGNITATEPLGVVVDRLPPLVGGSILSLGPQVLENNSRGEIPTLVGVDERITLSAVGGPISISLNVTSINSKLKTTNSSKIFSLTQSPDTGLWSGVISFSKPGSYSLVANSIDAAGNKTTRIINTVRAAAPAKVLKAGGQPVSAKVTVYYLEPDSNSWVFWDAEAYGQDNPQVTDAAGSFRMFLPAGTYYLKATGEGLVPITSRIFKLKKPSPILTNLKASRDSGLLNSILSAFSVQKIDLDPSAQSDAGSLKSGLLGRQVPDFELTNTDGQVVSPASLLGRPTIISFMSSWSPTTGNQLPALNQLASNKDINVEPIALQQNANEMRAYQAISGYSLNWLADPDSTTSSNFNTPSLPTHYFIDRNGVIRKIITGVLSKQEILNTLAGL